MIPRMPTPGGSRDHPGVFKWKESLMRGRRPSGPEFVDKLDGSPEAKERLKVLLETLTGTCRVLEACERLGLKEARFDQIRIEILQVALNAAERRPAGRPAHAPSPVEIDNEQLRARIAQLEAELQAALIRAELAVALPLVGASAEKKTTASLPRRGRPPKPKRSS
jgi:hypothetical protein